MPIKWTNKESEILNKYYNIKDKKFLLDIFKKINPNRTWISIFKKANKLGLRKITFKKEIDKILREKYSNNPLPEVLNDIRKYAPKINKGSLIMRANRLGLTRREFAFKEQEKKIKVPKPSIQLAWFLGVLAGDGYVSDIKNKYHSYLVTLSSIDKSFTLKFNKIGENLFNVKPSYKVYNQYKIGGKWRKFHVGRFLSKGMVNFLSDWREKNWHKTFNKKFNWILKENKYISSFLSAFFDCEGSVHYAKYTRRISFAVQNKKAQFLISKMLNKLGIKHSIYSSGVWINSKEKSKKLASFITSYISRKERLLSLLRRGL